LIGGIENNNTDGSTRKLASDIDPMRPLSAEVIFISHQLLAYVIEIGLQGVKIGPVNARG
jgi:hypothetical protein